MKSLNAHTFAASLRRRSAKRFAAVLLGLLGIIVLDQRGCLLVRNHDDFQTYHGQTAQVKNVITGDILEVDIPDLLQQRATTLVKLIGVQCERARSPNRQENVDPQVQHAHIAALQFTRAALATNDRVLLWLERGRERDTSARVLAQVELQDETRLLNERLLEQGLARVDDRVPHSLLVRYEQAERSARRLTIGIWSKSTPN